MALRLEDIMREYQMRRQELDRAGVYFLSAITDDEAERFAKALLIMGADRQGQIDRPISIYIMSGGGSVGAGFGIIEMINRVRHLYEVRVNTIVTGYAYSMGAIIFQAGDRRIMGPFSTLMLHSSSWAVSGDDDNIFEDIAKLSKIYRTQVGHLFEQRTGQRDGKWWERFIYSGRDKFLSPQECLKLGLADEVTELLPWRPASK